MTADAPDVSVVVPLHGRPSVNDVLATTYRWRPVGVREVVVTHCGPAEAALRAEVENADIGTYVRWLEISRPAFNKSLALNVGVSAATGTRVLLQDADVLVPQEFFPTAAEQVRPGTVCCLASVVESRGPAHRRIAPGVVMCTVADFQRVGGMKSGLSGWGWEDVDLLMRMKLCGVEITVHGEGMHLTHDAPDVASRAGTEARNKRRALDELARGIVLGTLESDSARYGCVAPTV